MYYHTPIIISVMESCLRGILFVVYFIFIFYKFYLLSKSKPFVRWLKSTAVCFHICATDGATVVPRNRFLHFPLVSKPSQTQWNVLAGSSLALPSLALGDLSLLSRTFGVLYFKLLLFVVLWGFWLRGWTYMWK